MRRVFRAAVMVVIALIGEPINAQPLTPVLRPHCNAARDAQVAISASPDLGLVKPDVLLAENTQVNLAGVARRVIVRSTCAVETEPMEFMWSMTFTAPGALPTNATGELLGATSLFPRFHG